MRNAVNQNAVGTSQEIMLDMITYFLPSLHLYIIGAIVAKNRSIFKAIVVKSERLAVHAVGKPHK